MLKVAFEAQCNEISIYGQEFDNTTVGLAIMNMYLHNCATAEIKQAAMEEGMRTMQDDGLQKVLSGVTSMEECLRVVYVESSDEF